MRAKTHTPYSPAVSQVDLTDIRSREKAAAAAKEAARRTAELEVADFKWLMSDRRGRRIVWGLLDRTGVYRSSFTGNSETFFREGERNIGLKYVALIHDHCPEKYALMASEQRDDRTSTK